MTLVEFLMARILEDEEMARAAVDTERPGTHWQWVTNETDTPVKTGDLAEAQDWQSVSLRTVEEYPTTSGVGPLPAFIITHTEEVAAAGDHIVRWDPARVLEECEIKRVIVRECAFEQERRPVSPRARWLGGYILMQMGLIYVDHPDYQQVDWRTKNGKQRMRIEYQPPDILVNGVASDAKLVIEYKLGMPTKVTLGGKEVSAEVYYDNVIVADTTVEDLYWWTSSEVLALQPPSEEPPQ